MPHLGAVGLKRELGARDTGYPFDVPAVRTFRRLALRSPVTFFAGENGSGKSTLLEAIAVACALPTVGAERVERDATLGPARELARRLRLEWSHRTHKGFFLRAEDFFGFARHVARLREEARRRITELEDEYREGGRSEYALGLAQGPERASLAELERRYGVDLDASSHGESFLELFASRFVPGGLYLLDEPEAPLSPQSQLALVAMLAEMVARDAQFVVATHSPILLAYPGAQIVTFDATPVADVAYGDLEAVRLMASFLADPERYLRHLGPPSPPRAAD